MILGSPHNSVTQREYPVGNTERHFLIIMLRFTALWLDVIPSI